MMKQLLAVFLIAIASVNLVGQYMPNGGFEDWDTTWMFREPVFWNTGDLEVYTGNYIPAVRTDDSYSGDYALKLQSASYQGEIIFGYALSNGMLDNNTSMDTIQYFGGFPVTAAPDSLHGYFKYHIASNDTAIGLISFKKNGKVIGQNMIQIVGSVSDFQQLDFGILGMSDVPDTAMLAFSCTNAFVDPVPGNWLIIDSLWFTGTTDTIPNCDFEKWDEFEYSDPVDWSSLNELIALNLGEPSATVTTDAYSGNSAIRLESLLTINQYNGGDTMRIAYLMPQYGGGSLFNEGNNFPLNINPSYLKGFYKFIPAGDDTAGVWAILTDINAQQYSGGALLNPTNDYKAFEIPFSYPFGTVMQQIYIGFTTNYHGQDYGTVGSVLYIDGLDLMNPCEGQPEYAIQNVSESICDPQTLDAGADWDNYYWSTGAYTRTIEVTEYKDYSVTVTDNNSGCYMMDTITTGQTLCDKIEENKIDKSSFEIYPVPASDFINIDFVNMVPGNYHLEITAITGSVVRKETMTIHEVNEGRRLSVTNLSEGLYLIKITNDNFSQIEKLRVK
jgi:hypothetical protein